MQNVESKMQNPVNYEGQMTIAIQRVGRWDSGTFLYQIRSDLLKTRCLRHLAPPCPPRQVAQSSRFGVWLVALWKCAFLQKRNELFFVTGEAFERRGDLILWCDYRVQRKCDRAESLFLHFLETFVRLAFAVGEKPDADKLCKLSTHRRLREHIGFHPSAVCARIACKIDQQVPILGIGLRKRGLKIIHYPRKFAVRRR